MEKSLARVIELSPTFAPAHSSLAEVKMALNQPWTTILPLLNRAITLEPASPGHRMAGARALRRFGNIEEAYDYERAEAERLLASLSK